MKVTPNTVPVNFKQREKIANRNIKFGAIYTAGSLVAMPLAVKMTMLGARQGKFAKVLGGAFAAGAGNVASILGPTMLVSGAAMKYGDKLVQKKKLSLENSMRIHQAATLWTTLASVVAGPQLALKGGLALNRAVIGGLTKGASFTLNKIRAYKAGAPTMKAATQERASAAGQFIFRRIRGRIVRIRAKEGRIVPKMLSYSGAKR